MLRETGVEYLFQLSPLTVDKAKYDVQLINLFLASKWCSVMPHQHANKALVVLFDSICEYQLEAAHQNFKFEISLASNELLLKAKLETNMLSSEEHLGGVVKCVFSRGQGMKMIRENWPSEAHDQDKKVAQNLILQFFYD